MKKFATLSQIAFASLLAFVFVAGPTMTYANEKEKGLEKIKTEVNNAAPDDWMTLALSAKKCIRKGLNLQEAKAWLDRSLEIKETSTNLEIKGDYYLKNKLPRKALEYYVKSKKKAQEENGKCNEYNIDRKITKANAMRRAIG